MDLGVAPAEREYRFIRRSSPRGPWSTSPASPNDGLLFPDIRPDRFGRRAGTATKWIGKWARQKVGITDRRFDPNHSWRHRFISECREAGVDKENRDALTGHSDGSVSRDYGEF